jgi:hypothetical protein
VAGPVCSSKTETEVALRMVQWAVHKLKQRWCYRWSSEQFLNWNRGSATDGPVSSSQTVTEVALRMNGLVGRTQTKTEVIQWPVQICNYPGNKNVKIFKHFLWHVPTSGFGSDSKGVDGRALLLPLPIKSIDLKGLCHVRWILFFKG